MEFARELDKFSEETDFKINYDKTSIYRIGSLKDTDAHFYTAKPFKWTNSPPKILGLDISTDICKMRQDNYNQVFKKSTR